MAKEGELGARQLANIANGVANCGRDNWLSTLFAPLATAVRRRMGGFIPQNLVNTAWAFAKAGQNDASLFAALATVPPFSVAWATSLVPVAPPWFPMDSLG